MSYAQRRAMEDPIADNKPTESVAHPHRPASASLIGGSRDENVKLLHQLLTPAVCRRLGLYPIPDTFLLSVIVPIYNEVDAERAWGKLMELYEAALA